ncbi:TIR domain-containing protein [Serratia symbiotica]|uniref:TIR domain-containing protein n=1 Tax=Serratia symbiotica TaxID=138074 RepID=UPI003313AA98
MRQSGITSRHDAFDAGETNHLWKTRHSSLHWPVDKSSPYGTSVTVVLIGATTNQSKWVKYEIDQSIEHGNGILTIDISKIADLKGNTTDCCSLRVPSAPHSMEQRKWSRKLR